MKIDDVAPYREEFLRSGTTSLAVREDIASSWKRSSSWSVRPDAVEAPYHPDFNPESRLLRAAGPVLRSMTESLGSLGLSLLVGDSEGLIIDRRVQDNRLLGRLDRFNVTPGRLFSEDAVGTNAIGTAIELGRTTRINGHEHYWDIFVGFTCVAVPIMDPIGGKPIGTVDVTCTSDDANPMLDLIAAQAARAIEARLFEHQSAVERALLERFLSANRKTRGGLVVLSDRILMANPQASHLFNDVDHPLIWDHASRALSTDSTIDDELLLPNGRLVGTRTYALRDGGDVIGSMMEMRVIAEERAPNHTPVTPKHRADCLLPPGLVSEDRALLNAYRTGAAAIRERAVVVSGEPGVGKATMGRALLADAPHVHEFDSALADENRWLPEIADLLRSGCDAILIQHADLLPPAVSGRLVALINSAGSRIRCVLTYTSGFSETATVLPDLDAERVRVPPLRNRPSDLPLLIAAQAGPRRVAPEVLQLLMRLSWPGNVRELRAVVRKAMENSPHGPVELSAVPADVRRAAPRRPLTRFEQAEMHAVLDALTETNGNKRDAAALLGISRSTLYRKLQQAGVELDNVLLSTGRAGG
ncbi:sigma-54-dependent Fis family transcriptional regulator [Streptomyces sp. NPDC056653]|uniref:sigma-54-dependent Fis family transcriptional regulator n=1 Tax=Streptomyces sp. NPDC056653 TaxID=3345894 RepID=UPI00369F05DD